MTQNITPAYTLLPFEPLQLHAHEIIRIAALYLNGITTPPGEAAAELERAKVGKDIVVKPAAQAAGVVTADLYLVPNLVAGAAISFDSGNLRHHLVADAWVFCHGIVPPFLSYIIWILLF